MSLSKEQILSSDDVIIESVHVPEWKGDVRVRGIKARELDDFQKKIIATNGKDVSANASNIRARLCALAIVDEDGKMIFTEADIKALGEKSAVAIDRVFTVARDLGGMKPEEIEEMAKNSDPGQSDVSTSA